MTGGAADGADEPDGSDRDGVGAAVDAVTVAGTAARLTAVRAGLVLEGDIATRGGGTGRLANVAGATTAPATEGAAGRRRLGVSGDQRAAAERVRTKPAA